MQATAARRCRLLPTALDAGAAAPAPAAARLKAMLAGWILSCVGGAGSVSRRLPHKTHTHEISWKKSSQSVDQMNRSIPCPNRSDQDLSHRCCWPARHKRGKHREARHASNGRSSICVTRTTPYVASHRSLDGPSRRLGGGWVPAFIRHGAARPSLFPVFACVISKAALAGLWPLLSSRSVNARRGHHATQQKCISTRRPGSSFLLSPTALVLWNNARAVGGAQRRAGVLGQQQHLLCGIPRPRSAGGQYHTLERTTGFSQASRWPGGPPPSYVQEDPPKPMSHVLTLMAPEIATAPIDGGASCGCIQGWGSLVCRGPTRSFVGGRHAKRIEDRGGLLLCGAPGG